MVCRVADNAPLEALRVHLDAPKGCHSQRVDCVHRLPRFDGEGYFGIAGAFIGYCQALFGMQGGHSDNTNHIAQLLSTAGLPWARSHELFLGHRTQTETVAEFVEAAAAPLKSLGRVPILITGLNVRGDRAMIDDILCSPVSVVPGETILCRVVAKGDADVLAVADVLLRLVRFAEAQGRMPQWWPLIQASSGDAHAWRQARSKLGSAWRFLNVAVNPYLDDDTFDSIRDQITVAQFIVPSHQDIASDGLVRLTSGMTISGASENAVYSIPRFMDRLGGLNSWPTSIFLGPALPHWTEHENLRRTAAAVGCFVHNIQERWSAPSLKRYQTLLELAA